MVKAGTQPADGSGVRREELLSLEELTARVGMSVRTVRFYASRGLVPAPVRRGRSGYYGRDHVARLELVQELQSHGFTLAAIERYVGGIPADASPEDVALRRAMLAPWQADLPIRMTLAEIESRADRGLDDDDLAVLASLGIVRAIDPEDHPGHYEVAVSQLSVGLGLLEVGFPLAAARAAAEVYAAHGQQIARELYEVFRTEVWPVYRESGATPATVQDIVERLKPLSINSLVHAYEVGMDQTKRANIAERAQPPTQPPVQPPVQPPSPPAGRCAGPSNVTGPPTGPRTRRGRHRGRRAPRLDP